MAQYDDDAQRSARQNLERAQARLRDAEDQLRQRIDERRTAAQAALDAGLSQAEVARVMGVTRSRVNKLVAEWKRGEDL